MTADLTFLVAGAALLLAVVLPELLTRWALSAPIVLVAVGMLIGLTPLPDGMPLDPQDNRAVIEHVTELTVIVALMGVGLALDRPLRLRDRTTWAAWSPTWRLLAVAMPLCVGSVALLGWVFGLVPAAALLLGAVLAPTDPVLASDVQVAGPTTGDADAEEDDDVRFALTSEAGLNDGLAFPFVMAAVLLATEGGVSGWWAGVGDLVRRRQDRHRPAGRRRGGLGAGAARLPVAPRRAEGRRARGVAAGHRGPRRRRTAWASWPAATGSSRSSRAR